jgi:ubiquinone/menaquinone biosynthesis C-methylase UbiE
VRERLRDAPELLDASSHDPAELGQSLDQVAQVNRWLGGRRSAWLALEPLLTSGRPLEVLDIGTGSADIPLDLHRRARRAGLQLHVTATDAHPQMLDIARERTAGTTIDVRHADALALPFHDAAFDVVLLSLTLHHFETDAQRQVLREARRVARRAVVINELERCRANYWGARALAGTLWRGNRLTRHDGPLSVLRAFTPKELMAAAQDAGLRVASVERRFFFRLVLVADARQHRP